MGQLVTCVAWICTREAASGTDDPKEEASIVDLEVCQRDEIENAEQDVATHVIEAHYTHAVTPIQPILLKPADELADLRPYISGGEGAC